MPNKSSNKGHIPVRTCVVCRNRKDKQMMIRFEIVKGEFVIDFQKLMTGRGFYLCDDNACIAKLDKWMNKKKFKRGRDDFR
ncbi:MAG: DUF448 domain-containing protein [Candidatus Cloacimonas sp.]|nr:DUF448 domain-containing protein [Candidatus Cloacimonadota bacterium]